MEIKKIALNRESNSFIDILPEKLVNDKCYLCFDKSKRPLNPKTGKIASCADKSNLSSFEDAISGVKKHSHACGVGIALGDTAQGNLCGIDIDNCINEQGEIAQEAQKIINLMNTYTELSPSKKGIHILFFAKKQGDKCKVGNFEWCKMLEMYDNARYFTLTGNRINDKQIETRQKEADLFYKQYFDVVEPPASKQQIAYTPKKSISQNPINSNKPSTNLELFQFGLIKDKNLRDYYHGKRPSADESSSDLSFMNKLAYWCNKDLELMIEIFKSSPYADQKDEIHKKKMQRADYVRRTALKALEVCRGR